MSFDLVGMLQSMMSPKSKGPNMMSMFKMLLPFLTDSNIQSVVPDFRAFIEEQQQLAGGHIMLTATLTEDGQQLAVRIWCRDPVTKEQHIYKEFDLFSLTQQQIKDFINGLAKQQQQPLLTGA